MRPRSGRIPRATRGTSTRCGRRACFSRRRSSRPRSCRWRMGRTTSRRPRGRAGGRWRRLDKRLAAIQDGSSAVGSVPRQPVIDTRIFHVIGFTRLEPGNTSSCPGLHPQHASSKESVPLAAPSRAEEWMSGMDRRSFFKIVATTGAAAAAGGCGQSAEQFIPYVIPPDNIVPGVPAYFASVCRECPSGCGVIAKNRDGRVIKLEGNPDHPTNTGALCVLGHAGLQALYHPDRFRGPLSGGKPVAWADAEKQLADKLGALAKGRQGARVAVVSGLETGSLARLMDEWVRLLGARARIAYEPLGYEALRASNRVAFGRDA